MGFKWTGRKEPYCELCKCGLAKIAGFADWRCPKCHREWDQPAGLSASDAHVGDPGTAIDQALAHRVRESLNYAMRPAREHLGITCDLPDDTKGGRGEYWWDTKEKTYVKVLHRQQDGVVVRAVRGCLGDEFTGPPVVVPREGFGLGLRFESTKRLPSEAKLSPPLRYDPLKDTESRSHCYPESCPVGCGVMLSRISSDDESIPVWRCAECTWTGTDRDRLEYLGEAVEDAVVERLGHLDSGVRIEEVEPRGFGPSVFDSGIVIAPYIPLQVGEMEVSVLKTREPSEPQEHTWFDEVRAELKHVQSGKADCQVSVPGNPNGSPAIKDGAVVEGYLTKDGQPCPGTCVTLAGELEDVRAELKHVQSGKADCQVCGDNGSNGLCPECGRFQTDDTAAEVRARLVKTVGRLYQDNGRLRDERDQMAKRVTPRADYWEVACPVCAEEFRVNAPDEGDVAPTIRPDQLLHEEAVDLVEQARAYTVVEMAIRQGCPECGKPVMIQAGVPEGGMEIMYVIQCGGQGAGVGTCGFWVCSITSLYQAAALCLRIKEPHFSKGGS